MKKTLKEIEKKHLELQILKGDLLGDIKDTIMHHLESFNNTIWFGDANIEYFKSIDGILLPHTIIGVQYDDYVRIIEYNYKGQYFCTLLDYDFKELIKIVKAIEKIAKSNE